MLSADHSLPNDVPSCHDMIGSLTSEVQTLTSDLSKTQAELQVQVDEMEKLKRLLNQLVNGSRSEKHVPVNPAQAWLPFESEAEFAAAKLEAQAEAKHIIEAHSVKQHERKSKPRNESLPACLPRVEVEVPLDDAIATCEIHGARKRIGEDVVETLVHVPPKLFVQVRRYPKYVCPADKSCGVASPERPTGLVEGNRYSPSVAAAIIDLKWGQYMPIYRHQDIFAASGWTPSRSTLLNLVAATEFVIDPLFDLMKSRVQNDIAVGLDDTSCRMLLPPVDRIVDLSNNKSVRLNQKLREARAKGEKSLLAKMWVYSGLHEAQYNIFDFRVSRHRDGPDEFFKQSRCKVQGDCFSGNKSVVIQSDGRLEFVACWAHARRKVVESLTYREQADVLLGMLQGLYDIETRGALLSHDGRTELRGRESEPVLATIRKWLSSAVVAEVLPKSDFAEAIRYIVNHWEALNVYVRDGRLPIDNNRVEQLMKQVALGRKAWLFVSNVVCGERSAKMMSLVSSARRHDLAVGVYLEDVLTQLLSGSTNYASLLPDIWKQSHPESIRVYRQEERRDKSDRKQLAAAHRRLTR